MPTNPLLLTLLASQELPHQHRDAQGKPFRGLHHLSLTSLGCLTIYVCIIFRSIKYSIDYLIDLFVHIFTHEFANLSTYLSIYLLVHIFIYLSSYLLMIHLPVQPPHNNLKLMSSWKPAHMSLQSMM